MLVQLSVSKPSTLKPVLEPSKETSVSLQSVLFVNQDEPQKSNKLWVDCFHKAKKKATSSKGIQSATSPERFTLPQTCVQEGFSRTAPTGEGGDRATLLVLEHPQQKQPKIPVKQKAESSEAADELWAVRLVTKFPKSFVSKKSPALKWLSGSESFPCGSV